MASDPELRRSPPDAAEPAKTEAPEGEQAIDSAQDVSLARGPEQEGGRRSTLTTLVVLLVLVVVAILLVARFA
jgi:hypothetical protein